MALALLKRRLSLRDKLYLGFLQTTNAPKANATHAELALAI